MKVLFTILNNMENKGHLFTLIDKYNGYLLPEILHIPLSTFDWDNNCYNPQRIMDIVYNKLKAYPVDYVVAIANFNICNNQENPIKYNNIIIVEEKMIDKLELQNLMENS